MARAWRVRTLAAAVVCLVCAGSASQAATEISLWDNGAPGAVTKPQDEPVLFVYPASADTATGAAVIVCPGGGYGHLAMDHEGHQIAERLNSFGVSAFVLRYRHAGTGHHHPIPLGDGQRAIRLVRSRAKEWKIDPSKIGVLGFSAGGHLVSTLGTHFDAVDAKAADLIDQASSRPDFMILIYPVITMTEDFGHAGSKKNLLGENPDPALARSLSSEHQVKNDSPPAFLIHTSGDKGVPPQNSLVFYDALQRAGVPAELHIYQNGGHGFGLGRDIPGTRDWPERCREWMAGRGLLGK
jgi:acetyl esterase/lipase